MTLPLILGSVAFALVVLGLTLVLASRLGRSSLPYPPGPPKHLIWGNYKDVQCAKPWYRFTEWKKEYGDLVHFSVLGQHNVVINTPEVAEELLTKRSAIYSDRPQIPMISLTGWDINMGLLPYGDKWRAHRRVFQQAFNAKTIESYRPLQVEKFYSFLNDLLDQPEDLKNHAHRLVASIIMKIVYGHEISKEGPDRLMEATELAVDQLSDSVLPGAWLVNSLPFLQHLPSWFPGCRGFNDFIRATRKVINIMSVESYDHAREYARDQYCLVTVLEDLKSSTYEGPRVTDDVYIAVCATAYAGGSETTMGALDVFMLVMSQHPEMQLKAYQEMNRVVGTHRLPGLEDRPSLPYVEAIFREVMRWMPVTPTAVPHYTSEEDVHQGYYIPKGCVVIPNVWAMCNDESKYADPRRFLPERFLTPEGTINDDDTVLTFGFGRRRVMPLEIPDLRSSAYSYYRICVGRHFAEATVWWTMAILLAGFELSRLKHDEPAGQDMTDRQIEEMFTEGLIVHAKPFRCAASPRSQDVVKMIQNLNI